jgi:hypothetical protein
MLAAGWIVEVWSYRKGANGRYSLRIERIGETDTDSGTQTKDDRQDKGNLISKKT